MTSGSSPRRPLRVTVGSKTGAHPTGISSFDRDRLAIMKIVVKMPPGSWYTIFTQRHPELLVEVTNSIPVEVTNTLAEIEIYGPPLDWTSEIAGLPDVLEAERLSKQPEFGRYHVRYLTSQIIQLTTDLEVMVRYPRTLQNGTLTAETIARLSQLRQLVRALQTLRYDPHITSIRRDNLRSVRFTLTGPQRALFRQALGLGYFEVPRRISLGRLAERVSRSKSSVSEMLAVVERKLAHSANVAGV
jgi:HTH DNA binding domain